VRVFRGHRIQPHFHVFQQQRRVDENIGVGMHQGATGKTASKRNMTPGTGFQIERETGGRQTNSHQG
jgi:hypothetical protein